MVANLFTDLDRPCSNLITTSSADSVCQLGACASFPRAASENCEPCSAVHNGVDCDPRQALPLATSVSPAANRRQGCAFSLARFGNTNNKNNLFRYCHLQTYCCQPNLSTNAVNQLCQPTLSTDSVNRLCQPTLSTNSVNQLCQPTLSTDSVNRLCQPTLTTDSDNRLCPMTLSANSVPTLFADSFRQIFATFRSSALRRSQSTLTSKLNHPGRRSLPAAPASICGTASTRFAPG